MDIDKQRIWSGSDFPYQCLVDTARTEAFRAAILATVKPGDVVLDAGSGSGILSFFAAQAGARQVLAVEFDPFVAQCLEQSVRANGLSDTITVICGDVRSAALPQQVDVFIAEMIDTGLIDEMQAEVINRLREQGVLGERTRMVPARYETHVALGSADLDHFGFRILMPQHRWPHQAHPRTGWTPARFESATKPLLLASLDFNAPLPTDVHQVISFIPSSDGEVNAIRITGRAHLTDEASLGATNAFNGDKIVPIQPTRLHRGQRAQVSIRFTLGAGFSLLRVEVSGQAHDSREAAPVLVSA
jgi:protein-L-isoaspartate O-methyltransferase